ncbi:hypothetical protein [Streptomyces vietnamensis]|uniref:hypothetical protein n=1 Tax=Streptomyces vietnamensis TaxID=362257 RepID=UPI003434D147
MPYGFLPLDAAEVGTAVMRIADTRTGVTLLPGCCNGLEERRDWFEALDARLGLLRSRPLAARRAPRNDVRPTVDAEQDDSPVIGVPVAEPRRLCSPSTH